MEKRSSAHHAYQNQQDVRTILYIDFTAVVTDAKKEGDVRIFMKQEEISIFIDLPALKLYSLPLQNFSFLTCIQNKTNILRQWCDKVQ